MRGSPGPGQEPVGLHPEISSRHPLQSLSRLSQSSTEGEMPPKHAPYRPDPSAELSQDCWPSRQAPVHRRLGGPAKQVFTTPGVHGQPSSTAPSQSSSRSLQSPTLPSTVSA